MRYTSYITALIKRWRSRLDGKADAAPDLEIAEALAGLMQEAEPRPDLFAQIEADLDKAVSAPFVDDRKTSAIRSQALPLILGIVLGVAFAGIAALMTTDRQKIIARPAQNVTWAPLGEVTLHGPDLRAFVRAKCRGYTHFYITMHGQSDLPAVDEAGQEVPLMNSGEKILMECIF